MEESRRKQWGERVNCWANAEVSEEVGMEEEGEDVAENKEDQKLDDGQNEIKDEELDERDEEGGDCLQRRLHDYKKDEKEDVEMIETEDVQESKAEEEWEDIESEEMDGGEDKEERKAENIKKREEDSGNDVESKLKEKCEEEEGESSIKREVKESEKSHKEVKEMGQENHILEDDNEDEEHRKQESKVRYDQEEDLRGINGIQVENIYQNQESKAQEDVKDEEEDIVSNTVKSINCEDSDTKSEPELQYVGKEYGDSDEQENGKEKSRRTENDVVETLSTQDRYEEDGSEKLTDDEETDTECGAAQEEFQEYLQDEDLTDDEGAQCSVDDDEKKIYCKDDYPTKLFLTLNAFRSSSLLTDVVLNTDDGKSFWVHSVVLAAVSSYIWKSLSTGRSKVENSRTYDRVPGWSVLLGPEVDHVGLEAIVEFAYTGNISCLNNNNVQQIRTAAEMLGAPRVLDLCAKLEESPTNTAGLKNKESISSAQQMMISLQFIKQLWMERVACDVILEAFGASLHVHRVILAVSSDYFRGMFTLGMKESRQPHVNLPFLLASELEVLVSSSYSGALPISWASAFEITSTALQLQYQPALSLCLNFLQQEINPHTCLDVVSFAEAYEMPHLLEVADDFVLRQFQKVACTSKFKDLPAKQLLKYLNSHSLCVSSEIIVFKAVVAWIQAKPNRRLKLVKELMKTVHFPLMTFKEFKEVQSQNMWTNHRLSEVYEAVFEEFCSSETEFPNQCRIYLPKENLVLIGGDRISEDLGHRSISRDLWFGNSLRNHTGIKKAMEWRRLAEMPEPARFCHEVAVLSGQLYVFGGKKYYGIGDTLSSVYRYDLLQNSWESLSEMQEKRCYFSVVVLDRKIYAIGGYCENDHMDSVECYCPTTNSWSFTQPLDLPLSGHVAKVFQGQVFVSGGRNSDYLCLPSMFVYHPETGSTYLANMNEPRAHHCMETLGECLYVAGGITTPDNTTVVDQLVCELYSPTSDSWTAFTSLPVPHVGAGSAVLEGKFYVLGGYSQEDYSDTQMVHRYDSTTQKWENMGKMPGPNNDLRASLLCVPQHFRV